MALPRIRKTLSLAHRSRVGARRARRRRKFSLPLGRLPARTASRILESLEDRARAGRPVFSECVRALQSWRQRTRMVFRLVRRRVLRSLTRKKSTRTCERQPEGIAWGLLAAPHQSHAHRCPLQHSDGVQICGLWISRRGGCVAAYEMARAPSFRSRLAGEKSLFLFKSGGPLNQVDCR